MVLDLVEVEKERERAKLLRGEGEMMEEEGRR